MKNRHTLFVKVFTLFATTALMGFIGAGTGISMGCSGSSGGETEIGAPQGDSGSGGG